MLFILFIVFIKMKRIPGSKPLYNMGANGFLPSDEALSLSDKEKLRLMELGGLLDSFMNDGCGASIGVSKPGVYALSIGIDYVMGIKSRLYIGILDK